MPSTDFLLKTLICAQFAFFVATVDPAIGIDELRFIAVDCGGRNCSTHCYGLPEWENPVICADNMPVIITDAAGTGWPLDLIALCAHAVQTLLLFLVLVMAVIIVRRQRGPVRVSEDELGYCGQCHRIQAPFLVASRLNRRQAPSTIFSRISLDTEL